MKAAAAQGRVKENQDKTAERGKKGAMSSLEEGQTDCTTNNDNRGHGW